MMETANFLLIAPEILLFTGILVTILMAAFMGDKYSKTISLVTLLFFALKESAIMTKIGAYKKMRTTISSIRPGSIRRFTA